MRIILAVSLVANLVGLGIGLYVLQGKGGWGYLRAKYYEYTSDGSPYAKPGEPFYASPFYRREVSVHDFLPIRPGDVVFVGDSHASHGPWSELYANPRVRNRGITGDETEGLLRRIEPLVRAHPAALFVSIGSNDVDARYYGRSIAEVEAGVGALLERVEAVSPQTKVYLLSTLPKARNTPLHASETPLSQELNERYAALAQQTEAVYIDLATPVTAADGSLRPEFTFDGAHLNGAAYAELARVLQPYVEEALRNSGQALGSAGRRSVSSLGEGGQP